MRRFGGFKMDIAIIALIFFILYLIVIITINLSSAFKKIDKIGISYIICSECHEKNILKECVLNIEEGYRYIFLCPKCQQIEPSSVDMVKCDHYDPFPKWEKKSPLHFWINWDEFKEEFRRNK